MRLTFLALVLLSRSASGGAAQELPWPAAVEARVVSAVAVALEVSEEEVVLEWGPYRGGAVDAASAVELMGRGAGGHWVARAELVAGGTASVRVRGGRRVMRPIAKRRIDRGETLLAADIGLREEIAWGPSAPEAVEVREGWVAQRMLRPGDALESPAVRQALAVVSGRPVEIRWARGSVDITVPGTAAGSGALGSRVFVRTESGERLSGVVEAPGVVNVSESSGFRTKGDGS